MNHASRLPACSIVSNNYLAYAAVFAASYREHHPQAEVYVCIVDYRDPQVDYGSFPFVPIFAAEIGISAFPSFAFRYDILELNTAVKPFLLRYLRDRYGLEAILYFDPDIFVYRPLPELVEALASHPALLTPHIAAPLDNAYNPAERRIRQVGVYNLGFLGLRLDGTTASFLDWWCDRLYLYCLNDPRNGLFVDQAWMSFAPAFLDDVAVLRDPTLNVAYWNLPQRPLRESGGVWEIEGRRLGFFHFSGLALDDLDILSRHQNRIRAGDRPELRPLFDAYRDRILAAGHGRYHRLPYGFGSFRPGEIEIPWVARRTLQRVDPHGWRWAEPFDVYRADSFFAWLVEPLEFPLGWLNRAVLALWEERMDLVREFRDVAGDDLPRYVAWLKGEQASGRELLPPRFLADLRQRLEVLYRPGFSARIEPANAGSLRTAHELFASLDLRHPGPLAPWLNEPFSCREAQPLVTRFMMLVHRIRADVQGLFPDPLGGDRAAFAYWYCREGAPELGVAPELVKPVRRSLARRSRLGLAVRELRRRAAPGHDPAPSPSGGVSPGDSGEPLRRPVAEAPPHLPQAPGDAGVNLVGSFEDGTSLACLTRGSHAAFQRNEEPCAKVPLDQDLWCKSAHGRLHQPYGAPYPVTILQVDATRTASALGMLPMAATAGGLKVGYWFWELAYLPLELVDQLVYLDELWAPSRFCRTAFESLADREVRLVPPCVPRPRVDESCLPDAGHGKLRLFASWDAREDARRGNPLGALDLMRRLKHRGVDAVELLLHVTRAPEAAAEVRELRRRSHGLAVTIHVDPTPARQDLLAASDALLELSRSSSVSLLAIEALYLEKPVIATAYGGVVDAVDETTGFPVAFELVRLRESVGCYPRGAVWAEPDLDDAAVQVEGLLEDGGEARRRARAGRHRVEASHGVEAAARRFRAELERLRELS